MMNSWRSCTNLSPSSPMNWKGYILVLLGMAISGAAFLVMGSFLYIWLTRRPEDDEVLDLKAITIQQASKETQTESTQESPSRNLPKDETTEDIAEEREGETCILDPCTSEGRILTEYTSPEPDPCASEGRILAEYTSPAPDRHLSSETEPLRTDETSDPEEAATEMMEEPVTEPIQSHLTETEAIPIEKNKEGISITMEPEQDNPNERVIIAMEDDKKTDKKEEKGGKKHSTKKALSKLFRKNGRKKE